MQIVSRQVIIFAMTKLREINPAAADQLSLNQLQQAVEFGVTTVMSGPDAPQPQHGKILAAAAEVMRLVQQHQNTHSPIAGALRQQTAPTVASLIQQIQAAFADTDPVALSKLLREKR